MSQRRDNRSEAAREYRAWYKTATWKQIRRDQLQTFPLCKFCEADGKITPATVCDHVNPHRGSWDIFVGGPFQSLCKTCHDKTKQVIEHAEKTRRLIGLDGWPTGD